MTKATFKILVFVGIVGLLVWAYTKGFFSRTRMIQLPAPAPQPPTPGQTAVAAGTSLANQAINSGAAVASQGISLGTSKLMDWLSGKNDGGTIAYSAAGVEMPGFESGSPV